MREPDHAYWRRRYWQETRNADQAHSPELRVFHRRLAQTYGDRLLKRSDETRVVPRGGCRSGTRPAIRD